MTAGMWGATIFLAVAATAITAMWIVTKPQTDDPAGVTFHLTHELNDAGRLRTRWHYLLNDQRGLRSTGYLTRASAVRAARTELQRLERKDKATQ